MGQRKAITVNTASGPRTLYYDAETNKVYSNMTGVQLPGGIVQLQALRSLSGNGVPPSTLTALNTPSELLTSGEFWSKGYLGITPEQRQLLFYYGSNNLPTGNASENSNTSLVQNNLELPSQGQIQMVKGPDGRWTYKMIGQVPGALVKATMELIRKMNARLDELAAALQLASSANRWTNLRDTSAIERFLTMQGYDLEIDGKMGKLTLAALRDWQSKNGLKADGLWGNNTEAAAKRAESTMMAPMQAPRSSGVTVESRTTPAYAGTTAPVPNLALNYTIGLDMANGVGIFGNGQLFGSLPMSPLEEAAQYQKRGGCMYKRGKRIK